MPLSDSLSQRDEETNHSTSSEDLRVVEIQEMPEEDPGEQESQLPRELPILPVRGMVMYPLTQIPVTVGQPRSTRASRSAWTYAA